MQAVPLPEAGEVTQDPGKLPQPDKVTKAYFEVCRLCSVSCHGIVAGWCMLSRLWEGTLLENLEGHPSLPVRWRAVLLLLFSWGR